MQTDRLSDGQKEACTNETKREGEREDFWWENDVMEKNYNKALKLFENMITYAIIDNPLMQTNECKSNKYLFEVTKIIFVKGLLECDFGWKNKEMRDGLQLLSPPQNHLRLLTDRQSTIFSKHNKIVRFYVSV